MKILSHRGYWLSAAEKNQTVAFERSFALDFGTETDVRDFNGSLVISHDVPNGEPMPLEQFTNLVPAGRQLPLAINVKADGLAQMLAQHFATCDLDWFAFDMSIPDMRAHLKAGNPVFARVSEVERDPAWLDEVRGIWLDAFDSTWFGADTITAFLRRGLRVCVVSPELHQRPHLDLWAALSALAGEDNLMLCTDHPEQAHEYFSRSFD